MVFEIKPRQSTAEIRKNVLKGDREALRESQQRREHLQKLAVLHAGQEVYVQLSGDGAYADLAGADSEFGYTDRIIINVRLEIPNQSQTNLDDEVWDMMVQKTDLYHELGHVLHTDWPSFEKYLLQVADEHQGMFKNWWDAIEDCAIERILIGRFNIKDDFRIVNENILKSNPPSGTVSLHEATMLQLREYQHPTGWIDTLLDASNDEIQFLTDDERLTFIEEILPQVRKWVPHIIDQPDPEIRNMMIYDLYQHIGIYFDNSIKPGDDEDHNLDFPDDADKMGTGTPGSMPDDGQVPDIDIDTDDVDDDDDDPIEQMDVDKQRDYQQQVDSQKQQMNQAGKAQSVEYWGRVIDEQYDQGVTMSLHVPDDPPSDGSFDDATYQEAKRISNTLAKDLRQRLRQQQRSQKQSKKKSGKIDSKRAHKANQGNTNVFTRHGDPDDRDYACMIALDRSASMGAEVREAEKSAGALALALEELDIEVGQVSVTSDDVWLEKDFAETVDEARRKMFRGYCSGGTPLSDALGLARARLDVAGKHPFMVVITDGQPDHRERYRDHLHKCTFPVMGLYIKDSGDYSETHMNEAQYFHAMETRTVSDAMDGLKHLVRQAMF